MKATIIDLRYKMNDVLKALDRKEDVSIFYHGKLKGIIKPSSKGSSMRIKDHPFFNMSPATNSVEEEMDKLRGGRYRDL